MTQFEEFRIKRGHPEKEFVILGFKEAFPIQEAVIPVLLTGRDVVGQAHTGSGKDCSFCISNATKNPTKKGIQGLIMAPNKRACNAD